MTKLNRMYKLKIVQPFAPTSSHHDETVERFYDDEELAMHKVKTMYIMVMGDFNPKVGKQQAGEQALGNFVIDSRNSRGDELIVFAERNNLRIMNHSFCERRNLKVSNTKIPVLLAQVTNLINRNKISDSLAYNMAKIEETLK